MLSSPQTKILPDKGSNVESDSPALYLPQPGTKPSQSRLVWQPTPTGTFFSIWVVTIAYLESIIHALDQPVKESLEPHQFWSPDLQLMAFPFGFDLFKPGSEGEINYIL